MDRLIEDGAEPGHRHQVDATIAEQGRERRGVARPVEVAGEPSVLRAVDEHRLGTSCNCHLQPSTGPIRDDEIDGEPRLEDGLEDGAATRDEDRQGHPISTVRSGVRSDLRGP